MPSAARVVQTGVRIESHPGPEPEIMARIERDSDVEAARKLRADLEAYRHAALVYVRGIAFVDVELDGERHRWEWTPSSAQPVPLDRPATSAVVDVARSVEDATRHGLLADARVAGVRVTRWDVESAPRVIELDAALQTRLVLD